MRYEDDISIQRPPVGVSPLWQLLAILSLVAVVVLLAVTGALAIALAGKRTPRPSAPLSRIPAPPQQVRPFLPRNPDDDEPPNPPYPTVADLQPAGGEEVPGEGRQVRRRRTPRERFLDLGQAVWSTPPGYFPQHVSVSPDGTSVACVAGQTLLVGAFGGQVEEIDAHTGGLLPVGRQAWNSAPAGGPEDVVHALGRPSWDSDGHRIYFADTEGDLRSYTLAGHTLLTLPFQGDCPLPVPGDPQKLVFRRCRPRPKADLPGTFAPPDPVEIVLGDPATEKARVLIPESTASWEPLAISPDGKQLALVSDTDQLKGPDHRVRLFLLDLTAPGAVPKPAGAPQPAIASVCWGVDSRSLVYAHGQVPAPPDHWEEVNSGFGNGDLYRLDLATGRETRLSRGGGCGDLSPTPGEALFYLFWEARPDGQSTHLQRVPLADALKFAAQEAELPLRDPPAWTAVIDDTLGEAHVAPDAAGGQLSPETLARLADTFTRTFRAHFKSEPPADADDWYRLQMELQALHVARTVWPRFVLVLGAAEGEYLRRRHGAVWHLAAGPLVPPGQQINSLQAEESPFGLVLNPFEDAQARAAPPDDDEEDDRSGPLFFLKSTLLRAKGRPLVLANDRAAGREGLNTLADPALPRAVALFRQNQGAEGDRLLLDLARQKQYEHNTYLVLHVAKVLYEHKRLAAVRQLLEPRLATLPQDPQKYNLLGLALVETDPDAAIVQFKNALRCNLNYGPGFLNLAQAYAKAHNTEAALLCLRHYLRVMPYDLYANDARQRLAALEVRRVPCRLV